MAIDTTTPRSRRALLVGAAGGLAALAAQALGRPAPAAATHQGFVVKAHDNPAGGMTSIATTGLTTAFAASSIDGIGVFGRSDTDRGVYGESQQGTAVFGHGNGPARGVYGVSNSGYGVEGHSRSTYGVYGTSPSNYAVVGLSSTSAGVAGFSASSYGVIGSTSSLVGVLGQGGSGRGGRFSGAKAQIRLDPSAAATHPASGQAGDIFLDKSKRLWLCKGGTAWVRLDL